MKKLILALFILLVATIATPSDTLIQWNPVCRHNAIFWASVVNEQYPIRFAFGRLYDLPVRLGEEINTYTWHVQPQVKVNEVWLYFKVENNNVVFINMPTNWKKEYIMYKEDYVDYLFRIDRNKKSRTYNE